MLTDCDQEHALRTEAARMAQILDISYETALQALRNLIDKGLIQCQ